jgi:hypothetical protein
MTHVHQDGFNATSVDVLPPHWSTTGLFYKREKVLKKIFVHLLSVAIHEHSSQN